MTLPEFAQFAQVVTGAASVLVAWIAIRVSRSVSAQQGHIAISGVRAYLINETELVTQLEVGKPVLAQVVIKNFGQTPALRVRATSRTYVATHENEWRGVPLIMEKNKAETIVPPQGAVALVSLGKDKQPLSHAELHKIKSGELTFFCDFLVEYYDVGGLKHSTYTRYFLGKGKIGPHLPFSLSYGKDGLSVT